MRTLLFGLILIATSCSNSTRVTKKDTVVSEPEKKEVVEKRISRNEGPRVTFEVEDVVLAKEKLTDTSFKMIFEYRTNRELYAYPEELDDYEYISCHMNGFLCAVHRAYSDHRPLEISPDDVWLTITQGFGQHVLVNADEMEDKVLKPNHPDQIVVREDNLKEGDSESWKRLIAGFTNGVEKHAKDDIIELVAPTFSTTTPVITTAYQSTVLNSMKTYFQYVGESGCGIPSVTLRGTIEDWEKIYNDVDQFNQYGMEEWVAELKPVLKEFINAYEGNQDAKFWQSIYKDVSMYGGSFMSGWILKFFPYLEYESQEGETSWESEVAFTTKYKPNPYIKGNDYLLSTISTSDIPKGFIELDFIWNEYKVSGEMIKHDMKLFAGFFGIYQNNEAMAISPNIGWGICEGGPSNFDPEMPPNSKWGKLDHPNYGFVPEIQDSVENMPSYNGLSFEESKTKVTKYLLNNGIQKWDNSEIQFVVGHNGKVVFQSINDDALNQEGRIKHLLENLPKDWTAATTKKSNFLDVAEDDEHFIPVNVRVIIRI